MQLFIPRLFVYLVNYAALVVIIFILANNKTNAAFQYLSCQAFLRSSGVLNYCSLSFGCLFWRPSNQSTVVHKLGNVLDDGVVGRFWILLGRGGGKLLAGNRLNELSFESLPTGNWLSPEPRPGSQKFWNVRIHFLHSGLWTLKNMSCIFIWAHL